MDGPPAALEVVEGLQFDAVILQLAILFLPGLIWARLDARYALKTNLRTSSSSCEHFFLAYRAMLSRSSYLPRWAGSSRSLTSPRWGRNP